jgi:anaphase-promoting complex subunit 6
VEDISIALLGDVESASLVLKGRAHEGLGDLSSAVECYKQALSCDVFCEEALERLSQHHALSEGEERHLLDTMPFRTQCSVLEEEMLRSLYTQKLQHLRKGLAPAFSGQLQPLSVSLDVLCGEANRHMQLLNMERCYQVTSGILERDPYHSHTLLLHVACCVEKNKLEELYSLGQALVNSAPNSALSWYVVGCYYLTIQKQQNARKYLTKAITLEPNFGHAHIAFGHSFAAEGEHDQAISAFSKAARTMKGSHLPLLYLGKEYHQTGVLTTSTRFMKSAFDLSPHDPGVLQEIGFMVASAGQHATAERYFKLATAQLQAMDPHLTLPAWEPLYNNLGHVLRKQGKYQEAQETHMSALQLDPTNPNTLTALAFLKLLQEDFVGVVEYANRSLMLKRGDQFTLEVLHTAMLERSEQLPPTPDLSIINEEVGLECKERMVLRPHPQLEETPMSADGDARVKPHPHPDEVLMSTD